MRFAYVLGAFQLAGVLLCGAQLSAQTLANPDISAVGDMRYNFRPEKAANGLGVNNTEFEFRELELSINAYLNPYMRGDVYIGIHGTEGPLDVEEAAITVLRGLPLSMQVRGGKYLLDFGRVNQMHPHQFAWLEYPLMIRTMLGEEGLRPVGAQVSTLQALGDNAVTLSLNAFPGDAFGHAHGDEHMHDTSERPPDIMGSARLSWFRQFNDFWSGEAGVSGLYGTYDATEKLKKRIGGFDLKLRWRPNTYRALVVLVEAMYNDSDVAFEDGADTTGTAFPLVERVEATGAFGEVEYQFARRFDCGAFYDWTQDAVVRDAETTAAGAFVGFMPAEHTARFSLVYRWEESDLYDFDNHALTIQFLWSLGPHKPHTY